MVYREIVTKRQSERLQNKIVFVRDSRTILKATAPTPRISVLAPDRAFYLSSVSNNLVKPRTPRLGYGRREERRKHALPVEEGTR